MKEYDNQGRLIFNRKPDGYEKNYTYSKAGKLLKESDSNSVVRNYVFEKDGTYSILETNSQNNSAYEKFDKYFRLIEYKSFANEVFKYDYDAYGNVIKETAANYSKVYDYDLKNRLVKSRLYDSSGECISQTEYAYDQENVQVFENSKLIKSKTLDAFGRVIEVNDKRGKTVFYYNEFGNITKKTDELGKNTYFEYNPYGDVKKIKDDFGNTTEYEFFPTGDIKAVFENGKKVCEYTYDDCFNLTKVENQFSQTNYEYDKTGTVNSLTKNESGKTIFQKGSDNRSLFITNSMNQKYEYFLDKNGNLSQIKNPLGKVQSFEYDKKKRVIEKKWNSGKITKYSYDDNANVIIKQDILNYKNKSNETEINQKKQAEVIIKKNALGQIIRAQNENSDLHFEYDFSGNLSKYNDKKNGITIEYFYDDFNRLVKKKSDSFDFEYLYDSLSRLISVNEKFHGVSANFEYDNCSREVLCTLSNGNTIETIYDDVEDHKSNFDTFKDSFRIFKILIAFVSSSVISCVVDVLMFAIFIKVFGFLSEEIQIFLATAIARVISSIVNYFINHKAVFKSRSDVKATIWRYYLLCIVQMLFAYLGVYLLVHFTHFNEVLMKLLTDFILFLVSFQIQRDFIFQTKRKK